MKYFEAEFTICGSFLLIESEKKQLACMAIWMDIRWIYFAAFVAKEFIQQNATKQTHTRYKTTSKNTQRRYRSDTHPPPAQKHTAQIDDGTIELCLGRV